MKRIVARVLGLLTFSLGISTPAFADWTRTYVMSWYEQALYYGAEGGVGEPGTDCPKGSNPEPNWIKVLTDAGYTEQEARWIRDPSHPFRIPSHGQNQMAFRGKDRANVYTQPWLTPDPGLTGVTGNIGEGLDLDGDPKTGFVSPDGERGIDNRFYRTVGCWKSLRGPPRRSTSAETRNDEMREGLWTIVIVVAGEGDDPMNDPSVRVGLYDSGDKLVKDALGEVARGYTFRIRPHAKFEAIFDARTVNGTIETTAPSEDIWMWDPSYARELQLLKARLRLKMESNGSLTGVVAGYRPWMQFYQAMLEARAQVIEQNGWIELPGLWYAFRRNADYSPTGPGGEKTHISYALRIEAIPAYVMTPDARTQVTSVVSYKSVAPPNPPPLHAFITNKFNVVDGLVPDPKTGVILAGPDVEIPPPATQVSSLGASSRQ